MKRLSSTQQWSRRRTEALLGLFKTQAPPDLRSQVLARVHERQHISVASRTPQGSITGRWQQFYAWLQGTILLKPRYPTLATAAGSVCVLFLSGVLLWWTCMQGSGEPMPSPGDGSLAAVPSPQTPWTHPYEHLAGATSDQAQLPFVATAPELANPIMPEALQQTTNNPAATDNMTLQKQLLLPPTIPLLQSANDPPPIIKTEPQRLPTKRALPARPKRVKKGQGMDKHVSA